MAVEFVAWIGAVAGLVGVLLGRVLHRVVPLPVMRRAANTRIPAAGMSALCLPRMLSLIVDGLVIPSAGTPLPASWAARIRAARIGAGWIWAARIRTARIRTGWIRTAAALRTE